MTRILISLVLSGAFLSVAACAGSYKPEGETISIAYDPYDFDPNDLQAEADVECRARGKRAVYEDETVDPSSVRWRYRHYRCV